MCKLRGRGQLPRLSRIKTTDHCECRKVLGISWSRRQAMCEITLAVCRRSMGVATLPWDIVPIAPTLMPRYIWNLSVSLSLYRKNFYNRNLSENSNISATVLHRSDLPKIDKFWYETDHICNHFFCFVIRFSHWPKLRGFNYECNYINGISCASLMLWNTLK